MRLEHHQAMQARAKERGIALPDAPPAGGHPMMRGPRGKGPGMGGPGPGMGRGMGPGTGPGPGAQP